MKVTNEVIQNATKELVINNNLDDINVISLCSKLEIKRQTFYYHYQNIYDVIESIFIDDAREFLESNWTKERYQERLSEYIKDNFKFLLAIVDSNVIELLREFFYDVFYFYFYKHSKKDKKDKKYIENEARYNAGGASEVMLYELKLCKEGQKYNDNALRYVLEKI